MMGWIENWLAAVTGAASMLSIATALTPKGSVRRVLGFAGGLMMILAAIQPFLKQGEGDWPRALSEFHLDVQAQEEDLCEKSDLMYEMVIEEKLAAYIQHEAELIGISCRVEVGIAIDETGEVYADEVHVLGEWSDEQKVRLSTLMETELGVTPPRQYFARDEG